MPELPEVETFGRYAARHALRQRIVRVEVRDERILGTIRKATFARKLEGRKFTRVLRHGKHLFVEAAKARDSVWLHLHFGMSGDLAYYRDAAEEPRFARIVFAFERGAFLAFEDMRLFGVADVVSDPEEVTARLGPDPLDPLFTFRRFEALLARRKGAMKSLLMSQEVLAGVGNLYADEILFQTSIHPRRPVDRTTPAERRAVFQTMRRVLREVIARHERGTELPARYLTMHREEGERCPRCTGTIARTVVFGRTTYFCRNHQKLGGLRP